MASRKITIPGRQTRFAQIEQAAAADAETLTFSFSSEAPVERYFGTEVLSHRDNAPNLTRLNNAAPLLWNHDPDAMIGVVEQAEIGADSRGYATVRFGTSAKAQEVLADVRAGIIRNVSVAYSIDQFREEKGTLTATAWTPHEVSLVSIPADPSVGLGRAQEATDTRDVPVNAEDEPETPNPEHEAENEEPAMTTAASAAVAAAPAADTAALASAVDAERARIQTLQALGARFNDPDLAGQLVESGKSIEDGRAAFLEKLGARQVPIAGGAETGAVDLSDKEQRDYSLVRAINAAVNKDWSKAGLEREVSQNLARELGRETEGFFMPTNLSMGGQRNTYAVGAAATGGNLVATNLLASSFIDVLRNKALIMQLGPTVLNGLVGNVAIPRQASATQTYWVVEGQDITQSEATFDQVTLSPKQIGAVSQYTRLMLQQSTPDIEAFVRNDLASVMALGIDLACISGTGAAGQPRGILNQPGIGSVALGPNGAALASLDPFIDLESKLDTTNALNGSLYYLTNAKVIGASKKLKDSNAAYYWRSDRDTSGVSGTPGQINGYPVARSNQAPSNLSKGTGTNLSAAMFGDFSQLLIGMWGGLEVLPNPYGAGYKSGAVDIRAMQTADINVRQANAFSAITDIVTG